MSIIPTFRYHDAQAAIVFLERAFGFERHLVVEGDAATVAHAQLTLGSSMIMLGSAGQSTFDALITTPREAGRPTGSTYIIVEDVDAHSERSRSAGAEIVSAPEDQPHGGRLYTARDPEGYIWAFGSYDPFSA